MTFYTVPYKRNPLSTAQRRNIQKPKHTCSCWTTNRSYKKTEMIKRRSVFSVIKIIITSFLMLRINYKL